MRTRPTSDRLRETLFNVLIGGNPEALAASTWLDLFAGTGAVGIEALSRGAKYAIFVDSSRAASKVIRENLKSLGAAEAGEILELETATALRRLESTQIETDFVFLDPPYADHEAYTKTLCLLSEAGVLKKNTTVIAEHEKRFDPGESFGTLQRYRKLVQGDSALSFYRQN